MFDLSAPNPLTYFMYSPSLHHPLCTQNKRTNMTQSDIQNSLTELLSHAPIRRVVWNRENKRSLSAALTQVLGDEKAVAMCEKVDSHIVGEVFKKLASHLECKSESTTTTSDPGFASGVVQCLDSVSLNDLAAQILQQAFVHCALRYLTNAEEPAKAYPHASEMLQRCKRYDETARVTELRHSADHLLNKCTTIGIENGKKDMKDEAAKFEVLCPIAKVVRDLKSYSKSHSSHTEFQTPSKSTLNAEKKKKKQNKHQQQPEVIRIRTRLDYDNRVSVWMHDAPDSETQTLQKAMAREAHSSSAPAVFGCGAAEAPAQPPLPAQPALRTQVEPRAAPPTDEYATAARVASWNTGPGRPQRRFTGLSTPSMPSWVGRGASRPGASARRRYRRNVVRKFFSRSNPSPNRARMGMGTRASSRITRCFKQPSQV